MDLDFTNPAALQGCWGSLAKVDLVGIYSDLRPPSRGGSLSKVDLEIIYRGLSPYSALWLYAFSLIGKLSRLTLDETSRCPLGQLILVPLNALTAMA